MNFLKFWYCICSLLCFYSLRPFIKESYLSAYFNDWEEPIRYLICSRLVDFQLNKTHYNLTELRENLIENIQKKSYTPNSIKSKFVFRRGKEIVLNKLKSGDYLILKNQLCLIRNDRYELYYIQGILPDPLRFIAFRKDSLDYTKMKKHEIFDQLIVMSDDLHCEKKYNEFHCLNDCYKMRFRLSKYYYDAYESGLIYLNQTMNQTIEENERHCSRECKRVSCKSIRFIPVKENRAPKIIRVFKGHPVLDRLDYWSQFIGLVCSFVGISIYQLLSISTEYIKSKIKRRKVRIGVVVLEWFLRFIVLLICCGLYTRTILSYIIRVNDPYWQETVIKLMKPEIVNLVICVPVELLVKKSRGYNLGNMTLSEIEEATDGGLDRVLDGIYWAEQVKPIPLEWMMTRKVLFRNLFGLRRCFQLVIDPAEQKYQKPFFIPELIIRIKHDPDCRTRLFLLSDVEHFNLQSFEFESDYAFLKRITRRPKSRSGVNCVDYKAKYSNCSRPLDCRRRCVFNKFFETYRNVSISYMFVIDRNQFSKSEWDKTYLIKKGSPNISAECEKEIPDKKPCLEVEFEKGVTVEQPGQNTYKIDLNYEVISSVEVEPSRYKLVLDILNYLSILIDLTVLKLLKTVYSVIGNKLKLRDSKFSLASIYLLCAIGFSWHIYYMIKLILSGELTCIQNYEIVERFQMPQIAFCHRIDESLIDKNHKLTGDYLEELTGNLKTGDLFKSIVYLRNDSNEWNLLGLDLVHTFYLTNKKCFSIKIDQDYERKQDSRLLNDTEILKVNFNQTFLFNETKKLTFMTKANDRKEFSRNINLDLKMQQISTRKRSIFRYLASQELLVVRVDDRFSSIKKPLPPWYETDPNDLSGYQNELLNNEHNLKSLYLPVSAKDFSHEIANDLFEQLCYMMQKKIVHTRRNNSIHEKELAFNHYSLEELTQELNDTAKPEFTFSLVYFKKIILIIDEDTDTRLTLSTLTMISFWFNFVVFDLCFHANHAFSILHKLFKNLFNYLVSKIKPPFIFIRKSLKRSKVWLKKRLRKDIFPETHHAQTLN